MRSSSWIIAGLALVGSWIGATSIEANAQPQRPDVKAELLVGGHDPDDPSTIWLGVRVKLGRGWKMYWRSPGDSGLPPEFDWSQSKNLAQAETLWPAPKRMEILGLETIGYAGDVVFPVKAQASNPAAPSQISLALVVYACSTICVREDYTLTAAVSPAGNNPDKQELIGQWRARVPTTSSDSLSITSTRLMDGSPSRLEARARSREGFRAPDLFVESDPPVFGSKPRVEFDPDGAALFTVTFEGTSLDDLRGRSLRVTLVDGAAAVEAFSGPPAPASAIAPLATPRQSEDSSLWVMLAVALAGGFILNVMPCVLPVLSLKLLALVDHHNGAGLRAVRTGFAASAAGIVASFLVLASAMVALQVAGATIGWGIQFQQPLFLALMAAVLAVFAANLLGLFEIALPFGLADRIGQVGQGNSLASHFGSGFVATLLATPCSAPFVGTAVGFALSRGPSEIYLVFLALGVGMAVPYLLIAAAPRLATLLPRPGRWMLVVRRTMAAGLLATAAWLLTVVGLIAGPATGWSIAVLLGIGLTGLWLLQGVPNRIRAASLALICLPAALVTTLLLASANNPFPTDGAEVRWRRFDESAIRPLILEGRTVLVDITAAWCVTCKVNKTLVLDDADVANRLRNDVVPVQGDWTKPDERIATFLQTFGRYGIPFNVVYGPGAPNGIVLPELLSKGSLLEAFDSAGSKPGQISSMGKSS